MAGNCLVFFFFPSPIRAHLLTLLKIPYRRKHSIECYRGLRQSGWSSAWLMARSNGRETERLKSIGTQDAILTRARRRPPVRKWQKDMKAKTSATEAADASSVTRRTHREVGWQEGLGDGGDLYKTMFVHVSVRHLKVCVCGRGGASLSLSLSLSLARSLSCCGIFPRLDVMFVPGLSMPIIFF